MRGDTDRATVTESLGSAAAELLTRAEQATGMIEVQALVGRLCELPGVVDAEIALADGGAADTAAESGDVVVHPIGASAWRQVLRVRFADIDADTDIDTDTDTDTGTDVDTDPDVDARRAARSVVAAIVDAAGRALRLPCTPVPEDSPVAPPLYHTITRHARALILVVDPVRGWTPMSESFADHLGYRRDMPSAGSLIDLVHPDDRPAAISTFMVACAGRDPAGCVDLRLRTADGRWLLFEFATRSFVGLPGVGVVVYFGLDVTAQRAAEKAVRVERGRLLSLVETLRDGILLIDEDQRITVANQALHRLLRLNEPLRVGLERGWAGLLAQMQAQFGAGATDASRLRDIVTVRRAVVGEEVALVDGRTLELDFVPLHGEGSPRGVLVHVRDATSRVAIRRGLEERNRSLAQATALNNQFVATVAHELRGPLSSVVAFAHLLGDNTSGLLSEDQRTYLDVIDRNANRLLRLIEDLLLLSRLEARTMQLRTAPVRLPELVFAAITERTPAAEAVGLRLVSDCVDGPELPCDEMRVHQVLDNLINNALKFTQPGGSVTVRANPTAEGWQLQVSDTGVGIPANDLSRVFSPFFRGANIAAVRGQSPAPGTGLGLVVSRAIVELHGGTIQVASTEGVGTTVTVSLPTRPVRRTEVDRERAQRAKD